jgi:hypothetical protein
MDGWMDGWMEYVGLKRYNTRLYNGPICCVVLSCCAFSMPDLKNYRELTN